MAFLATALLGENARTLRALIRAEGLPAGRYRLVVQSYAAGRQGVPHRDARPLGSVQRAVTGAQLVHGVTVELLEVSAGDGLHAPYLVAWVESGEPNLEFDARRARPRAGSVYGTAHAANRDETTHLRLTRAKVA